METAVVVILLIGCLGGFYAGLYYLNKKAPIPAGCEDLKVSCKGCSMVSCDHHEVHQKG